MRSTRDGGGSEGGEYLLIATRDGVVTSVSGSMNELLGYCAEDLIGHSVLDLVDSADREAFSAAFSELSRGGSFTPRQFQFRHKNGSARGLQIHGTSLLDQPVIRGLAIAADDVPSLHQLDRDVASGERLESLSRFAAHAAHDFNNVLMGIQPAADALRRRTADPNLLRLVDLILSSIARGKRFTSDVMRFGRLSPPVLEQADVGEVISAAVDSIRADLPAQVRIEVNVPEIPAAALVDRQQLAQAIHEVMRNACEALPDKTGTIAVAVHREHGEADFICISIADTGEGIAPADLPFIFDPLFTKRKPKSGIGLAVVERIMAGHHGRVVVSRNPDRGMTFHLLIPAAFAVARTS